MKRHATALLLLVASSSLGGCGYMSNVPGLQQPGAPGAGQQQAANKDGMDENGYKKGDYDKLRQQEAQAAAATDAAVDTELDKKEKDALKSIRVSLGKEASFAGMPATESASKTLTALKAAKVDMRLEAVTDQDGKAVGGGDFLTLKDSGTEKIQALSRKMQDGKATAAEKKEIQKIAKSLGKVNDLRQQVSGVSMAAMMTNNSVVTDNLTAMMRVSGMVRMRKLLKMEWTAEDYAVVKGILQREKRSEAIAATNMAMLATYQAVINDNGDPKALDAIAESAEKAFPLKVEVTDAEAKAYVEALNVNVAKTKARYEAMMRKIIGDKQYEKQHKASIDNMFRQAETASQQKSVGEIKADVNAQYKADVAKCMRGEDPGPGSMAGGPSCKELKRAQDTGDTSRLLPGAKQAFIANGGTGTDKGKAGGLDIPQNGDDALDAAAKMLPADGAIGNSLQGIAALRKGDAKGAINAALGFVPVPGLKDAFGFASKLLFKSG